MHKNVGRKVNSLDSVKGGTAATNADPQISWNGKTSPNSPDSIRGGSAATNFDAKPMFEVPVGGMKGGGIKTGSAYTTNPRVEGGSATNDRSK